MDKKVNIKFNLKSGEKIEWIGKPNYNLKNKEETILVKGLTYLIAIYEIGRILIVLMILIYLFLTKALNFNEIIFVPVLILFFLIIVLLSNKSKSSVEFCITNERVVFNSWNIFRGKQSNSVLINQIEKLSLQEFENGVGTIYIQGSNIGTFKNTEHYPGLIAIENSKIVLEKLSDMMKVN